jgi:hypothetical protein
MRRTTPLSSPLVFLNAFLSLPIIIALSPRVPPLSFRVAPSEPYRSCGRLDVTDVGRAQ